MYFSESKGQACGQTLSQTQRVTWDNNFFPFSSLMRINQSNLLHLLLEGAEERIMVEKAESILSVEETGTTQVEDTDDGNIA